MVGRRQCGVTIDRDGKDPSQQLKSRLWEKELGFSKFNSDAYTSEVFHPGEGGKWSSKESFLLGMTLGCQQTVDSVEGHKSRRSLKERVQRDENVTPLGAGRDSGFRRSNRSKGKCLLSQSSPRAARSALLGGRGLGAGLLARHRLAQSLQVES